MTKSAKTLSAALALGAAVALTSVQAPSVSAQASRLCTQRTDMVAALKKKYQEQRRGLGVAANYGVMEFFVSPKGTWTVVMSTPNGMSCILAAGRDWEELAIKPAGTNI